MKKDIFEAIEDKIPDLICKMLTQYDEIAIYSILGLIIDRIEAYMDIKYGKEERIHIDINELRQKSVNSLGAYVCTDDEFQFLDRDDNFKMYVSEHHNNG